MKKGLHKAQFSMTTAQLDALRDEAQRRMVDRGRRKIDTSEVLRECVDAWMNEKKTPDAIEKALDDARQAAAEAYAKLSNEYGPEAVKQARAAGRQVDAACRATRDAIRRMKAKR